MGEGTYFNVGIGIEGKEEKDVDVGRMKVTENEKDWAAFKPPSLRNVTKSAPYFHDGHASDLKEAVKFMASVGGGFSLLRCASSRVSSLCCAIPRCCAPGAVSSRLLAVYPNQCGGRVQCDKGSAGGRNTAFFQALDDSPEGRL
jgi:hypothetical protein